MDMDGCSGAVGRTLTGARSDGQVWRRPKDTRQALIGCETGAQCGDAITPIEEKDRVQFQVDLRDAFGNTILVTSEEHQTGEYE
eukprot:1781875-Pyramimonas_sp.AAC.1